MIIAINGRIGHGKDTVGRIIQYLTMPGKKFEYIGVQTYDDYTLEKNSPFKIKKFAAKLKTIASLLTGIPVEKFEDQEFKKTTLSEEWDFADNDAPDNIMTIRMFLQKLGTEAMRNGLHENVWVNALFADYIPIHTDHVPSGFEYPNWIITDCRFENETQAVKERGGITIRVTRYKVGDKVYWTDPEGASSGVYEIAEVYQDFCIIYNAYSEAEVPYHEIKHYSKSLHTSETGLDNFTFDYEILNNGSIEDLVEKVREILINEKLL